MNANQISVEGLKLKVLAYGKSGTGKTTFACTFPKPYIFDFDGGMLSQRGKDIEFDTYHNWKSFEMKLRELEQVCKYETLVIDSVTTMQEYMMAEILSLNKRSEPTLHEWGRLIDWMQGLFLKMTKMVHHIVVVAHEQVMQDEITSEILVLPLIVGKKLPAQLPLWFDEVFRCQTTRSPIGGKPVYQILTTADVKYTAKSRLGCLDSVEVPDYNVIISKLKASVGGKK